MARDVFKGVEKGDLPLRKGDIVEYLYTSDPGWWMVKKESGREGFVPKEILDVCYI